METVVNLTARVSEVSRLEDLLDLVPQASEKDAEGNYVNEGRILVHPTTYSLLVAQAIERTGNKSSPDTLVLSMGRFLIETETSLRLSFPFPVYKPALD